MSMEIIFVIAAVTGRTLVLPPKEPLYRLRVSGEARTKCLVGPVILTLRGLTVMKGRQGEHLSGFR